MYRLVIASLLALSCGPKTLATNPPPAEASNAPWVKEHRELVRAGCDCDSSSCLEELKTRIDALEAKHGGLDESPAEVHIAHGEFARCYQDGTRDPVRDLKTIARRLCGCATEACVKQSMIARLQFEDKYGAGVKSGELAELDAQYEQCKGQKMISGEDLAAHYERVMTTVCACASKQKCGTRLTDLPPMPAAVLITDLDSHQDRIEQATEHTCNCAQNAGLLGTYGGFAVTQRCKPPEK